MASRIAKGVYSTLVQAQSFLLEYLNFIGCEELPEHVLVKMLNDSFAESFFGHMSELTAGNNLTYLQMARLISKEAFHYLLVLLSKRREAKQVLLSHSCTVAKMIS